MPTKSRGPHSAPLPLVLGLAASVLALGSGCAIVPTFSSRVGGKHAFITYWPPAKDSTQLKLAVKDNIDVKGAVTTAGSQFFAWTQPPAKEDAPCLDIARARGVQFVGKTNLSEFAVSPSGFNEYFGTPKNPFSRWKRLIPGGSSCGSAVAVATGYADVAFGTDTAGSIRVPAACCGVVGLKTTHGLISVKGIHPIDPEHLDTVGPIARTVAETAVGMDLLQNGFAARYAAATAAKPVAAGIRVGRLRLRGTDSNIDDAIDDALTKSGFVVVPLDDDFREKWERAKKDGNNVAAAGAWISDQKYTLVPLGVSARTKTVIFWGQVAYLTSYRSSLARLPAWQETLRQTFQKVDFIALPTMQSTPPLIPQILEIGILEGRMLELQNTVAVNFAGNPALAVPVPLHHSGVPLTSLQLIGPRNSEAQLLNAGRFVEAAVKAN